MRVPTAVRLVPVLAPAWGGLAVVTAQTGQAGPGRIVTLPAAATLSGSVTDDGPPNPPGTATSGATGTYVLRLADQRTADLTTVLQEIVARSGGNAVVLLVTGTGSRVAESFDGGAAEAPVLHVEYTS